MNGENVMSRLIYSQLQPLKKLFKAKGNDNEIYGIVQNSTLYFNNGIVGVKASIDIPFECAINLHQLHSVLQAVKKESVVVYQGGRLTVTADDITYNIDSIPLELMHHTLEELKPFEFDVHVQCDKPYIFNKMMNIASDYVPVYENGEENITQGFESLLVYNNSVIFTDKRNIIQAMLDFSMPNMAFDIYTILMFNKISNGNIVGMGVQGNLVAIKFDNGVTAYLKNVINDNAEHNFNKILKVVDANWQPCTLSLPPYIKEQVKLLSKLTSTNVVTITPSYCHSHTQKIDYPQFSETPFVLRLLLKPLKTILDEAELLYVNEEKNVCFISADNLIRGIIGLVQKND